MTPPAGSSPTRREPLTRQRILEAAVAIADGEGLDALSMRNLGRHLGVEAMSLYNHVDGKDDVLRGIIDLVLAEIDVPRPGDDWAEAMRRRATSARTVFSRHPWAIGILERHHEDSSPRRLGYYDAVLGALREAGFSPRTAMRGFSVLDAYIYGFILQETSLAFDDQESLEDVGEDLLRQMADAYPHLTEATRMVLEHGYDRADEFACGLELIIEALERRRGG